MIKNIAPASNEQIAAWETWDTHHNSHDDVELIFSALIARIRLLESAQTAPAEVVEEPVALANDIIWRISNVVDLRNQELRGKIERAVNGALSVKTPEEVVTPWISEKDAATLVANAHSAESKLPWALSPTQAEAREAGILLQWAMERIEKLAPHRVSEGDAVLYQFASAKALIRRMQL